MYGAQVTFGIARQAATGLAVTNATSFFGLPFTTEDIGLEKEELVSQNIIGRFEQGAVYDGISNIAGQYNVEATPKSLLALLAAAVNHSPASVTSGSVVTRTFLPNTVDYDGVMVKAPYTIYKRFSGFNTADNFYDCQFGQFEIQISAGQFTRARAQVVGGTDNPNGIAALSVGADTADVGRLFPWNVASLSLGGSGLGNFSDITVSLNENIRALPSLNGTLTPYKYTRDGFREVTVSGTFYLTSRTQLDDFRASAQRRLLITLVSTVGAVQSGYYNTLIIDVPQMKITQFKPAANGPGEVSVNLTGRGVVDPTSGYSVQYTLVTTYTAGL